MTTKKTFHGDVEIALTLSFDSSHRFLFHDQKLLIFWRSPGLVIYLRSLMNQIAWDN
ncbi:MAG: hypothetical protein AAFR77_03240 [Cyanobacteria bacterium J06631_2]